MSRFSLNALTISVSASEPCICIKRAHTPPKCCFRILGGTVAFNMKKGPHCCFMCSTIYIYFFLFIEINFSFRNLNTLHCALLAFTTPTINPNTVTCLDNNSTYWLDLINATNEASWCIKVNNEATFRYQFIHNILWCFISQSFFLLWTLTSTPAFFFSGILGGKCKFP